MDCDDDMMEKRREDVQQEAGSELGVVSNKSWIGGFI